MDYQQACSVMDSLPIVEDAREGFVLSANATSMQRAQYKQAQDAINNHFADKSGFPSPDQEGEA